MPEKNEDGWGYAEERVTILLDQIKRLKSEIKSREEEVTRLCKKYGISVILD